MRGLGLGFSGAGSRRALCFNAPGIVTLPSWLTFSCASVRSAQLSASTLLLNVATNQAVVNVYGLQHEAASANSCNYSQNFAAWSAGSSGYSRTTGVTDPAGGTTAALLTTAALGYGVNTGISSQTSGIFTISGWCNATAHASAITDLSGTKDRGIITSGTGGLWRRLAYSSTDTGAPNGILLGDARSAWVTDTSAATGNWAFLQLEHLPYATSYIVVPSTSSVARAASVCGLNPNTPLFGCRIGARMELASTAGVACTYLCNPAGTTKLGFDATGHVLITSGNAVASSAAYTWAVGDVMDLRPQFRGSTTTLVQVAKNGVAVDSVAITNSTAPAFAASGNFIGINQDGTGRVPACAYPNLELF